MKNYQVRLYQPDDAEKWNRFLVSAKNATFLFDRGFMDYHSDRFTDHSLVVEYEGKWVAVLPLNVKGTTAFSHGGLTYGGLLYSEKLRLPQAVAVFREVLRFLAAEGLSTLHMKLLPSMYCDVPSQEIEYALFLAKARLTRRDTLSVVKPKDAMYGETRKGGIRKAMAKALVVKEETQLKSFWEDILTPHLQARHGVAPVHSLPEIERLQRKFPANIRHFNVYEGTKLVAGATIFESKNVAHAQYIMADDAKNENGSLDFLMHTLIRDVFAEKNYFDFGTSNEQNGTKLNGGLSFWKESFGAGTFTQDFYEVDTAHYSLLEDFLL